MLNTSKASRSRQPNSEPHVYVLSMFLGTRSFITPFACNLLYGVSVLPFFAVNTVPYR